MNVKFPYDLNSAVKIDKGKEDKYPCRIIFCNRINKGVLVRSRSNKFSFKQSAPNPVLRKLEDNQVNQAKLSMCKMT